MRRHPENYQLYCLKNWIRKIDMENYENERMARLEVRVEVMERELPDLRESKHSFNAFLQTQPYQFAAMQHQIKSVEDKVDEVRGRIGDFELIGAKVDKWKYILLGGGAVAAVVGQIIYSIIGALWEKFF